jgi:hypothetical protein
VLACPFCGAPETARLDIEGRRFFVFQCQFTPEVEPGLGDDEVATLLRAKFGAEGPMYFRKTCDALHVYVAKGEGARILTAPRGRSSEPTAP